MKFTDIFIRRPVLAISISLMILLLGLQALRGMQTREYPTMTNTMITVSTSYYGASSDVIQGFITQPLQQAVSETNDVDYIQSKSLLGVSIINIYMKLEADPDAALADVLAKVNSVRAQLPKEALDPSITRTTGESTSIMYLSFSSDTLNSSQITDYLNRVVQPQLITVQDVSRARLMGESKYAMHIWMDPEKLAVRNLTAADVSNALQRNNYRSAPGQIKSHFYQLNVTADTDVNNVDEFLNLIVAKKEEGIIRLRDIAQVTMDAARRSISASANGQTSVMIGIDPTPSGNSLDIAADIRAMLPDIDKNLPDTIKMELVYDSTEYIQESINEVIKTIGEATVIVILVIFLFMGSLRAVIIPVLAIPLSLIGVLLMMSLMGFTINLLTLLAMVLAIGLVVDDAIVVVENVDRHIKEGASPFNAAIKGTREIALPVISMTVTLVAVYAPIAFMGGLTGTLFKEFALTLAGAVVVSGIVALTLSPMMSSKIMSSKGGGVFEKKVHATLDKLDDAYSRALGGVLNKRPVILTFAIIIFTSLYFLFTIIPSELAPEEDKGVVFSLATMPNSGNLDMMEAYLNEMSDRAASIEEVKDVLAIGGVPGQNQGIGIAQLKSWEQRDKSQKEVVEEVKAKYADLTGVSAIPFPLPALPGSSGGLPIQFVIKSPSEYQTLELLASAIRKKAIESRLFVFTNLDIAFDTAAMKLKINKDKAGLYGITMEDIGNTLALMMSDGYLNHISFDGRSYEVIPQVTRSKRFNPESIYKYYVRSENNRPVPLSELVEIELKGEPLQLIQFNQINAVTLGAVPAPGVTMGQAIAFLEKTSAEVLPKGFTLDYMGEARQYKQEGTAIYETFVLALLIIFLVLASQFESIRDPLVIMVSVPLAVCGALLVLGWGVSTMNIYTQVGLVTLIGLITKHGILICEVAKERQLSHQDSRMDAVKYAARIRLRPILMTTISMVAGLIPLLLAAGAGAASRFDIGVVIVAGLTIGTLFTLFVLPVIYSYMGQSYKALPELEE